MKKEILSDEPIDKPEEDFLGREDFAKNLAESLNLWNKKKSLIIGLFGKWGSGKTSVINLAEYYLEEKIKEQIEKTNNPIIIKFNPWSYSETKDLISPFINQIRESIEKKNKIKNTRRIIRAQGVSRAHQFLHIFILGGVYDAVRKLNAAFVRLDSERMKS